MREPKPRTGLEILRRIEELEREMENEPDEYESKEEEMKWEIIMAELAALRWTLEL